MACCYNAEIQYVNEILCIEIYNIGLMYSFIEDINKVF